MPTVPNHWPKTAIAPGRAARMAAIASLSTLQRARLSLTLANASLGAIQERRDFQAFMKDVLSTDVTTLDWSGDLPGITRAV